MFFASFARVGVLAAAATVLAACTVVVEEEPRPLPPRPGAPQICTQQYEPVCAVRGDRRRTFPNACIARAEDYRPIHPGECGPQWGGPPPGGGQQFCTREYRPVCAVRGNRMRTFGNACEANAEDYRIVRQGEC